MNTVKATEPRWHLADLANAASECIITNELALRDEHAVRGLDALDEVAIHPLLAEAFLQHGFGVAREERYITPRISRRRKNEGPRCDLVLTPDNRPLQDPEAAATLFDNDQSVSLDAAYWLEVKVVGQFTENGPNSTWSSELLGTVRKDISKLAKDRRILHAGLLIILWTETTEIATHDLCVWQDRCLEAGLPIGAPVERSGTIVNRLGNNCWTLRIYPVHNS